MSFFFSWFRKKQKYKRLGTSTDSSFDGESEMNVSTEDLYSGSYFSVENELSYITNSGYNYAKSAKTGKHQSINRGCNKTMDLSKRKDEQNNSSDDHSGDLWRILMES